MTPPRHADDMETAPTREYHVSPCGALCTIRALGSAAVGVAAAVTVYLWLRLDTVSSRATTLETMAATVTTKLTYIEASQARIEAALLPSRSAQPRTP